MAKESDYQRDLKKRLSEEFPGCYILKNDPTCIQGIPDLTILYHDKWAALEVKRSEAEKIKAEKDNQTQAFRVNQLNSMSYAAYIYPENEEEIFDTLKRTFRSER